MEAAGQYEKGLAYLTAAKKILAAARRLDDDDMEKVRHLADGLVSKATDLLTSVVRPRRSRLQSAPATGEGGSNPE